MSNRASASLRRAPSFWPSALLCTLVATHGAAQDAAQAPHGADQDALEAPADSDPLIPAQPEAAQPEQDDAQPDEEQPDDAPPDEEQLDASPAQDDSAADDAPDGALQAEPARPQRLSLPGSPRPLGLSLAPEAPPVPAAPGGRAPSFGTPLDLEDASFSLSGNIQAWQSLGIGRRPDDAPDGYEGTPVHVPPLVAGRIPFWRQAELSLFLTYGTPVVNATIGYFAFAGGREYQGYRQAMMGPTFSQAYLTINPDPLGDLRLRVVMGAFTETFAGPGQWGWGIFGPLIAVRGYGASAHMEYTMSPDLRLTGTVGAMGVPGIPEGFPRGEWTGWTETGVSTLLYHAHFGFAYQNKFSFRLHHASGFGTDERQYLVDEPRDGRMDVYAAEAHWYGDPWGHIGLSGGMWDFTDAFSVHDALWWGLKWTKGSQDMLRDYIGTTGSGNGRVMAVSAEYNMSLARMAWSPRPFDGRAPDVRLSVAGAAHRTIETDDPAFRGAGGWLAGVEAEYQMLPWFSMNLRSYAENRAWFGDRWAAYNIAPGLAFRTDWQSPDRIELWYSRHFYSDVVDNNPAQPLDQHVLALGVFVGF